MLLENFGEIVHEREKKRLPLSEVLEEYKNERRNILSEIEGIPSDETEIICSKL